MECWYFWIAFCKVCVSAGTITIRFPNFDGVKLMIDSWECFAQGMASSWKGRWLASSMSGELFDSWYSCYILQATHGCGDLIFSSHTTFALVGVMSYQEYGTLVPVKVYIHIASLAHCLCLHWDWYWHVHAWDSQWEHCTNFAYSGPLHDWNDWTNFANHDILMQNVVSSP